LGAIAVGEAGLDDVFTDDITVPAADGYKLAATLFLPAAPSATPS
jgi:predicted acyl esterase